VEERSEVRLGSGEGTAFARGMENADLLGMSKPIPEIQKHMTPSPHSIGAEQTLARAHAVMQEHNIRHLPVLHGGRLVGIITDRDVHLLESLKDVDPRLVTVSDAMAQTVYSVAPETPLDEVAREMAKHKYGSAVVMQNQKVVGVFTTVDACNALADLLHSRLAK
jgi:acetoin utilization protein AcuB